MISSSQRPLPDNTRHSQQTNIHAPGGIRTHDLSRWAACGRSPAEIVGWRYTASFIAGSPIILLFPMGKCWDSILKSGYRFHIVTSYISMVEWFMLGLVPVKESQHQWQIIIILIIIIFIHLPLDLYRCGISNIVHKCAGHLSQYRLHV